MKGVDAEKQKHKHGTYENKQNSDVELNMKIVFKNGCLGNIHLDISDKTNQDNYIMGEIDCSVFNKDLKNEAIKESYSNFLKLLNLTEEEFLFEINQHPVSYCYTNVVSVKKSDIEGVGCFSKVTYKPDQIIGEGLYEDFKTELGRYINHSAGNPSPIQS